MRNVKKTLLIVSVALIAGGAVLAGGAWAAAGFDLAKLSTHVNKFDRQTKTLEAESTAPHKAIRVESEFGNVKLVPADGDASSWCIGQTPTAPPTLRMRTAC